jgi:hypothetical protein
MTWTKLLEAVSLAELDILRDSRQDIRDLKWAQPAHREAMNLYFGIKGAKEEPRRLNVEIRRILTFMIDDHVDYWHAIAATCMTDPHMAFQLSMEWQSRQKIHARIMDRLRQTAALKGFSGHLIPGHHAGHDGTTLNDGIPLPLWAEGIVDDVSQDWEDEEDIDGQANALVDFMENLVVD